MELRRTASGVFVLFQSACTVKATTNQTTDTTSNITGTTSGRTWFTEDGLLFPDHKLDAFLSVNARNLEEDSARGGGEYLSLLSSLLKRSEPVIGELKL